VLLDKEFALAFPSFAVGTAKDDTGFECMDTLLFARLSLAMEYLA
jgi:hypothetical protein